MTTPLTPEISPPEPAVDRRAGAALNDDAPDAGDGAEVGGETGAEERSGLAGPSDRSGVAQGAGGADDDAVRTGHQAAGLVGDAAGTDIDAALRRGGASGHRARVGHRGPGFDHDPIPAGDPAGGLIGHRTGSEVNAIRRHAIDRAGVRHGAGAALDRDPPPLPRNQRVLLVGHRAAGGQPCADRDIRRGRGAGAARGDGAGVGDAARAAVYSYRVMAAQKTGRGVGDGTAGGEFDAGDRLAGDRSRVRDGPDAGGLAIKRARSGARADVDRTGDADRVQDALRGGRQCVSGD